MLIETLAIWLILCTAVAILAWIMRSFPVAIVSSFGLVIAGLQYWTDEEDYFVLAMLIMLAFALPMAVSGRTKRGH